MTKVQNNASSSLYLKATKSTTRIENEISWRKIQQLSSDAKNWLKYLISLDPEDESGAFLTPDELDGVNEAYERLNSNASGPPRIRCGSDKFTISPEEYPDDALIKSKLRLAFKRAFLKSSVSLSVSILGEDEFDIKISDYAKGHITGKFKVIFPKSRSKVRVFKNEIGWKASIEITRGYKFSKHTIYARGLCMNVIHATTLKESFLEEILNDCEMDDSEIVFKRIS